MGLPRRHARRAGGRGVRRLRGVGLGHRAAHRAARRPGGRRHGAAVAGPGARIRRPSTSSVGDLPPGYRHVLDASTGRTARSSLVHEDQRPLRRMAVFDALVNNADRKGGHVLAMADGHRYGVDHGVCFHVDDKLRTVLWGWADEPLLPDHRASGLATALAKRGAPDGRLEELLGEHEVDAFAARWTGCSHAGRCRCPRATGRRFPGRRSDSAAGSTCVAWSQPGSPPRSTISARRPGPGAARHPLRHRGC